MASRVPYSDEELARAVAQAGSWRGVLRCLGVPSTSSSAIRSVRRQAENAGLDYSHFLRPPRVTEARLREAVAVATTWSDVTVHLVRIQVKTTTHQQDGRWTVWLSSTSPMRTIYASDEVDAFYVIDGDHTHYWLPIERVAGFQAVALTAYSDCILTTTPG